MPKERLPRAALRGDSLGANLAAFGSVSGAGGLAALANQMVFPGRVRVIREVSSAVKMKENDA